MALKAPIGGMNRTFVFEDGAGTAGTLLFTFDQSETSEIVGSPLLNNLELSLGNKIRNPAFLTFKQACLRNVEIKKVDLICEDGSKQSGTNIPSGAVKTHVVHLDGALDGQSLMTYFCGVLVPDTGNHSRASGSLGDTPVKFMAVAPSTAFTLGTAVVIAAASDVLKAASLTVASFAIGGYGCEKYQYTV